jgi:hypothetical protein
MVTARHVIEGIEGLGHKTCVIRMNTKSGEAVGYEVPIDRWLFHPDESEVDVAVFPYFLSTELDHLAIRDNTIIEDVNAREENIGLGDEVFVAGMFYDRIGNERNIPIVRVGNIAAMPHPGERVRTLMGLIDAYLIEVRSLGGISGAPVFVNLGVTRNIKGQIRHSQQEFSPSYLIGLIHGHYDYRIKHTAGVDNESEGEPGVIEREERINKGIAIVVPSNKILEVINQPVLKDAEKRARERALKESLPTQDMVNEGAGSIELPFTKESFDSVLRRVSRKVPESQSKDSDTSE